VNFDLSDDQVALRDGIRSLLAGRFPMDRVRQGFDGAVHAELAQAGVFSLRQDGFGWADAAIVYEELGRAAVPGPLVACFGRTDVASCLDLLIGGPPFVPHLDAVDTVLVFVPDEMHEIAASALHGEPLERPLDPLTPLWRVDDLPLGGPAAVGEELWQLRLGGALLTAAQCVGLAAGLVDLAVAYAKEREQFGRPIGSFQAVKHLCADMTVRTEIARAAVHAAACVLDDPAVGDIRRTLAGARVLAGEAAVLNGRSATQVFGGMGFTWEVDVHLYLKRGWVLDTAFGDVDHFADVVAETVGVAP
jgi:alkylation response protein AidB-like acyl-CoA dehydrogenase